MSSLFDAVPCTFALLGRMVSVGIVLTVSVIGVPWSLGASCLEAVVAAATASWKCASMSSRCWSRARCLDSSCLSASCTASRRAASSCERIRSSSSARSAACRRCTSSSCVWCWPRALSHSACRSSKSFCWWALLFSSMLLFSRLCSSSRLSSSIDEHFSRHCSSSRFSSSTSAASFFSMAFASRWYAAPDGEPQTEDRALPAFAAASPTPSSSSDAAPSSSALPRRSNCWSSIHCCAASWARSPLRSKNCCRALSRDHCTTSRAEAPETSVCQGFAPPAMSVMGAARSSSPEYSAQLMCSGVTRFWSPSIARVLLCELLTSTSRVLCCLKDAA
mmetsp:Transcript_90675/g.256863  ORF Transcript_90675/g.256863 Transcript_90675/m.256863 type:complete len:334 (+) Transcript_90675:1695-2696(+)